MKQTALQKLIEWGDQMLDKHPGFISFGEAIDKAEELLKMEKEQIVESYCEGCLDISKDENIFPRETGEQYYNKKYGKLEG